jgi:hypothetical protein
MTVVSSLQVRPADRSLSAGKATLCLAGRGVARARTGSAAAAQDGEERHILDRRPGDGLTVFRFDQPASGIGHTKAIVRTKKAQRATLKATGKPVDYHPRARSQCSHVTLRQHEHQLEDIEKARPTLREVKSAGLGSRRGSR